MQLDCFVYSNYEKSSNDSKPIEAPPRRCLRMPQVLEKSLVAKKLESLWGNARQTGGPIGDTWKYLVLLKGKCIYT